MPSYTISILRHDDSSELFTFEQASVIVGREAGDVITGDPKMSNRHAELKFNAGQLTITDLSSTNGTYLVSGQRLSAPHPLVPGTALKLGDCTLAVQEVVSGFERGGTQVMNQAPVAPAPATPAAALDSSTPLAPSAPPPPAAAPEAGAPPQGFPLGGGMGAGGAGSGSSASDRVKEFERDIQRQVADGPASEGLFDQFKYYLAAGLEHLQGALHQRCDDPRFGDDSRRAAQRALFLHPHRRDSFSRSWSVSRSLPWLPFPRERWAGGRSRRPQDGVSLGSKHGALH